MNNGMDGDGQAPRRENRNSYVRQTETNTGRHCPRNCSKLVNQYHNIGKCKDGRLRGQSAKS